METVFSGQSWPTQCGPCGISIREGSYPYLNAVSFRSLIFHIRAFTWPIEPGLLNKSHGICKNCLVAADKDVRGGRSFRLVIHPRENFIKIVRTSCWNVCFVILLTENLFLEFSLLFRKETILSSKEFFNFY